MVGFVCVVVSAAAVAVVCTEELLFQTSYYTCIAFAACNVKCS